MTDNKNHRSPVIIFHHVQKTGGTTLRKAISKLFKPENIFIIDRKYSLNILQGLTEDEKTKIKFITGHCCYGVHKFIPQQSTYITMVRDPIERVISHYYFVRSDPNISPKYYEKLRKMSLKEYVQDNIKGNNHQTRALSGKEGICTKETFELAKENIKKYYSVIGLLEDYDKTILLLNKEFGWKNLFYVKDNETKERPLRSCISKDTLECIEENNKFDIEIYRFGKSLFDLKVSQQDASFDKDLKVFILLNGLNGIQHAPEKVEEIDEINALYFKDAFDDALAAIYFLLKSYPYNPANKKNRYEQSLFNYRLASLMKQAELFVDSEQWFLKVLEESNYNQFIVGANFHLGEIFYKVKKYKKSYNHFTECLKHNPYHMKARSYYDAWDKGAFTF